MHHARYLIASVVYPSCISNGGNRINALNAYLAGENDRHKHRHPGPPRRRVQSRVEKPKRLDSGFHRNDISTVPIIKQSLNSTAVVQNGHWKAIMEAPQWEPVGLRGSWREK